MSVQKIAAAAISDKEFQPRLGLLDLPDEMLSMIVGYLNVTSKICVWKTCEELKRVLSRRIYFTRVNLENQRLPRYTLDFLRDNACYIEELNLSGATGYYQKELVSVLKKLKHLKSLDVTYNIAVSLKGVSEVCAACPRLVHLACNSYEARVSPEPFKNLEWAHFVFTSTIIFEVLIGATDLKELKVTDCRRIKCTYYEEIQKCFMKIKKQHPKLQFFSWHFKMRTHSRCFILREYFDPNWDSVLAIRLECLGKQLLFVSPRMYNAVTDGQAHGEDVDLFEILELDGSAQMEFIELHYYSNINMYAWRSNLTAHNPTLYVDILRKIKSREHINLSDF